MSTQDKIASLKTEDMSDIKTAAGGRTHQVRTRTRNAGSSREDAAATGKPAPRRSKAAAVVGVKPYCPYLGGEEMTTSTLHVTQGTRAPGEDRRLQSQQRDASNPSVHPTRHEDEQP